MEDLVRNKAKKNYEKRLIIASMQNMKHFLTIVLLLIQQFSFGQTKTIQVPVYRDQDTTFWYKWVKENIQTIGLPDLTTSNEPLHFRFWTETQVVDIWTVDKQLWQGKLINFTKAYDPGNNKTKQLKTETFYSRADNLDITIAHQVFEFVAHQRLFEVPVQDSIKGWGNGTDGDTYLIEYATPTNYSFKNYWTPSIQKGISEAVIIDTVYKYLNVTLNMNRSWSSFIHGLPKGCYLAGSYFITCNNIKKKKHKKHR
jgi:hypothetical protein